jgi:hypothetical protein
MNWKSYFLISLCYHLVPNLFLQKTKKKIIFFFFIKSNAFIIVNSIILASRNDKELCYTGYKTFDTNNKSAQVEIDTRGRTMFFTITQT